MIYNIRGYHGGLGDQLQFSSFPETLVKLGHKVNLYTGPDVQPFRNNGIKELVWDINPHITGTSAINWNVGDVPGRPYKNICDDYIKNWELAHDLLPQNSLPKIYYQPQNIYGNFGLLELSSITLKYNAKIVAIIVNSIISGCKFPIYQIINGNDKDLVSIPNVIPIYLVNLRQICDYMHSCKIFISLNSGLHSLAASVQRFGAFEQHCILPAADYGWITEGKRFMYPGINYIKE